MSCFSSRSPSPTLNLDTLTHGRTSSNSAHDIAAIISQAVGEELGALEDRLRNDFGHASRAATPSTSSHRSSSARNNLLSTRGRTRAPARRHWKRTEGDGECRADWAGNDDNAEVSNLHKLKLAEMSPQEKSIRSELYVRIKAGSTAHNF
jgi:hypothetical protein